ncbi:TetR/AcrR family transcriptional regulator [Rhizobium sp. G21]|uniref:TetR/AcrR family transcriptional regulator n=1 Tax=Rhizobium sp. G21 TaxID=2758439 RepID=UPI0016031106|nr:TetR/AcrR family transcriptional regulator [Rhizobium sp. G21]MBB1248372.1 TetR/AcrR family transcriptional regulator [Rhizobium sp. G21]
MAKKRSESMEENRARLLAAARKAFAEKGYMAASMDDFTAEAGLTRGALYHAFGDKRGLFAAVVHQVDSEMAARARAIAADAENGWEALQKEAAAYIEMALDPEVQRIVLLDGPSVLGDPSQWPSQSSCLAETRQAVTALMADGVLKPVDPDAAARLLTGAALNAALWVAASLAPDDAMPKAIAAFRALAEGFRLKEPG